ncbi:MAG TPA: TRAM domain-containing protein, partial [Mycobacterium sp.]|nr:TRAM domain-containing protein [Mycobacterium sp.]
MLSTTQQELVLTAGPAANCGSCVARHEGRVVFVRYALPGERVRARVTDRRDSYWQAEAVEILEPSEHRIEPLCRIAGPDGAGCCDLAFAEPGAARVLKAQVVANQLSRLAGYEWTPTRAEPLGSGAVTGWRTRVRLAVGDHSVEDHGGRVGFHRYHSAELVTDLDCGQLPPGMLAGLGEQRWPAGAELHVVLDDAGHRHVVRTGPGRTARPEVVEGSYLAVQRCGGREWHVPVTAFWQAHR